MRKIILIDDVVDICENLAALLKIRFPDIHVDVASNGLDGLKLIKENYYNIILTDLDMPIMTGEEMISEIQQNQVSYGKIYIMSGYFENQNKKLVYDKYFTKPMNLKELILEITNEFK